MALPAFARSRRLTTITTGSRLSSSRVRVAGLSCLSSLSSLSSLSLCSLLSLSLTATRVVSASRCLPPPSILGLFVCLGAPMARPPPQRANDLQRFRRRPSRPVAGPTLLTRTLSAPLPMAGPTRRVPAQRGNPSPPSPPALGEGPQAAAPFAISLGSGFFLGGGRWQAGLGRLPSLRRWVGPRGLRLYCCAHWTRCPPGPPSPSSSSSPSGGV